mmetsp:Transcript_11122/g.29643  ORF Transcript_11122/g.29643 Transcript_11122/m.29643 type:complete len:252 (-) Transcript_11122:108-863(-)
MRRHNQALEQQKHCRAQVHEHDPFRQRARIGHLVVDKLENNVGDRGRRVGCERTQRLPRKNGTLEVHEGRDQSADNGHGGSLEGSDSHRRLHPHRQRLVDEVRLDDHDAQREGQQDAVVLGHGARLECTKPGHAERDDGRDADPSQLPERSGPVLTLTLHRGDYNPLLLRGGALHNEQSLGGKCALAPLWARAASSNRSSGCPSLLSRQALAVGSPVERHEAVAVAVPRDALGGQRHNNGAQRDQPGQHLR